MDEFKKLIALIENQNDDKIPDSVVYILYNTGFDTKAALKSISEECIKTIEEHFNDNFDELISDLADYRRNRPFKILPGHRALILTLPEMMIKTETKTMKNNTKSSNDVSFVLKWLIDTAENNAGKEPKARRFQKDLQLFATYLYLMCGKSCYETLSANLPIPQAQTVCNFFLFVKKKRKFKSFFFVSELHSTE